MEEIITLTMNKSSQVTIPVAVKRFLGLGDTGTLTARMRKDGVLEISREKTLSELRGEAFAAMSPMERRRVNKRMQKIQEKYPNLQDRIAAEKDSISFNHQDWEKHVKKYGKF